MALLRPDGRGYAGHGKGEAWSSTVFVQNGGLVAESRTAPPLRGASAWTKVDPKPSPFDSTQTRPVVNYAPACERPLANSTASASLPFQSRV